jgi:adenylate kinase
LFENLLKQLIIHRPDQPLDFLTQKLQKPEGKFQFLKFQISIAKRIFLMGPPGSGRKETALALSEYFSWGCISIGDLLKKQIHMKSDYGKQITESLKHYRYGKLFNHLSA